MQRRHSLSGPLELHLSVERRERLSNPVLQAATCVTSNHTDAGSRSCQPQIVEVVDGSGSDLIPQSPSPTKIQQLRWGFIFWALIVPYSAFVSQEGYYKLGMFP